jgi:DNA-binding transcriptional LysR family regulator
VQWDDLRVFLAVAEAGSLRRAARALRIGQPTVARHLRQLEQSLGGRLFERTPDGHRLTRDGQDLLPLAQRMADSASAIDRRRASFGDDADAAIRIVTNEWPARFLAPRLGTLVAVRERLAVALAESHLEPDLERREADLFVRHGLPARGRLVRVRLGTMAAAIYGAAEFVAAHPEAATDGRWSRCTWVAYDAPHEYFRSMAWLRERLGDGQPRVRASRVSLQLEAIRAGAGLGILPCFVGDADVGLVRVTPVIDELAADYWLLVHADLRAVPRVRHVIDWIREVFADARAALRGQRASARPPSR